MALISRLRRYDTNDVTTGSAARKKRERAHAIRNEENTIATRLVQNARFKTSRRERWLSSIIST